MISGERVSGALECRMALGQKPSTAIISYSPYCMHCMGVSRNEIGETIAFCEDWDLWRNVTLGDCFGNCEGQEVVDGGEPWKWDEAKKG